MKAAVAKVKLFLLFHKYFNRFELSYLQWWRTLSSKQRFYIKKLFNKLHTKKLWKVERLKQNGLKVTWNLLSLKWNRFSGTSSKSQTILWFITKKTTFPVSGTCFVGPNTNLPLNNNISKTVRVQIFLTSPFFNPNQDGPDWGCSQMLGARGKKVHSN